jgi:hypothetical protein
MIQIEVILRFMPVNVKYRMEPINPEKKADNLTV